MQLSEMERLLGLKVIHKPQQGDVDITVGYVSDLLSDVIGRAVGGSVWVTTQSHPNIVAVAVLAELPAIILANGIVPQSKTVDKVQEQNVALYGSEKSAFTLVGELYKAGLCGGH